MQLPPALSSRLELRKLSRATGREVSAGLLATRSLTLCLLLACLIACGPGFFAREAPPEVPLHALAPEDALGPELGPRDLGSGCSPKGCLRPPAALLKDGGPPEGASAPLPRSVIINHPLRSKSSQEIERLVRSDLASLGSMSFGNAIRGGLLNAVRLPEDPRWVKVDPAHVWGTTETVQYLTTAIGAVYAEFPDSHPLFIGDISRQRGGYLSPHISHQSGKDVDIGYFYSQNPSWYTRVTPYNFDRARSWALVRSLIARTDVQFIFIDRRVQRLLRSYAESIGEDQGWLKSIFNGNLGEPSIIRHEPGHDTHLHVRFYNPIAEETARRCYSALLAQRKLLPMRYNIRHKVRRGETLIGLAKRYRTTPRAIMRANALTKSVIFANKTYFIPQNGPAGPAPPTTVPARRIPPPRMPTGPIASAAR